MPGADRRTRGPPMTLGIIGVGHIAGAVVTGLCTSSGWSEPILLSPRSAAMAAALAARFPSVTVAADNQAVIDGCDRLVLAVRPQVAAAVLDGLHFRPDQPILNLIGMGPEAEPRRLVRVPAVIVPARPPPSVAEQRRPIGPLPA